MPNALFYSWQSDSPSRTNRSFIETALEKAIEKISKDITLEEADRPDDLAVDKDTKGVAGSPPIVETIFRKIEAARLFVADLTFVGLTPAGRSVCNNNVTIEYGWALAKLGHERIVGVMNTAYGEPTAESLPFDIRHMRWPITYRLAQDASQEDRRTERQRLTDAFATAVRSAITAGLLREPEAQRPTYIPLQPKTRISSFLNDGELLCHRVVPLSDRDEPSGIIWQDGPQIFMRLVPDVPLTPSKTTLDLIRLMNQAPLTPLGNQTSTSWEGNEWGVVVYAAGNEDFQQFANRMVQITDRGEIWGIDGRSLRDRQIIPFIEPMLVQRLNRYMEFCRTALGMTSTITVTVGLSGVRGYKIALPPPPPGKMYLETAVGPCVRDDVVEIFKEVPLDADPLAVLVPFFDLLWETCQVPRPSHLPRPA
jgi:hypothetical protein